MTSSKADAQVAEFLRRVLADDNDVAPVAVIFGQDATAPVQQSMAYRFASAVRELGYIEPTVQPASGPEGDLQRVRVTPHGQKWLDEYERQD